MGESHRFFKFIVPVRGVWIFFAAVSAYEERCIENIDRFTGKVQKYLDLDEPTSAILKDMVKAVRIHL